MTLEEIAQLLVQIINGLASLQGVQVKGAVEHNAFLIETAAINAELALVNPTYGLAALHAQIAALQAQMISDDALIVTDILTRQASGAPVTFPPTPPAGFGGDSMASAVWQYPLGGAPLAAGDFQIAAGQAAIFKSGVEEQVLNTFKSDWWIGGDWADSNASEPDVNIISDVDPSTIISTDATVKAWLERIFGGIAFQWTADNYAYTRPSPGTWQYTFRWSDADFQAYKAGKFGVTSLAKVPPIWPGLANVTLLTEVAITDGLHVSEVCDGCLIYIYDAPVKYPRYEFGDGKKSWSHLGALTFINDNADFETSMLFGMEDCIYVPRTMVQASGIRLRIVPGVTAGCQPFLVNT
jgi:hypothetical protein